MNQQQPSFLERVVQGSLFTHYFLSEGVQQTPEYQQSDAEALTALLEEFQKCYLDLHGAQSPDEADTEDTLIEPILDKLGFQARSRQKTPRQATRDRPDFLLFADADSKRKALQDRDHQYQYGVAILEAKRFERPLDKRSGDPLDRGTPSNQILRYLSAVEPASNGKILWGILTNGRLWRLYYHKAKSRIDGYIEFDLDPLLNPHSLFHLTQEERLEAFKLFYLFFRRDAFVPTAERPGQTFLQFALEEGKNYEERVTEDLKQKIFEEVFILLARGFVEDAQRKGAQITQEFLDEVYKNVLTLLYRLLFILYAEDRDLLPVRDVRYDNYSLRKVRDEIERRIDERDSFSRQATSYWDHLKALFRMINSGDPSLNVPVYNGGLFDPQAHPFLEQYAISDHWLAQALDLLSRDHSDPQHPRRINYRDLGVRQLGSIYEGLLEFKLRIAEEDLVVVKDKDGEHYLSKAEAGQKKRILDEIKKGELFITNYKSERKATGSYYTPDYIVQYIVENTLGPLVQRIEEEFESKREELRANRKLSARAKTVELAKHYDPAMRVLELKVLDPAMGSGHFLVAAVDFLADRINSLLEKHNGEKYFGDEPYESPLYRQIEEVRQKIRESAAQQGIELDESKLEDKHIVKRMVMKRCIYGVDLNEMAVELAKVSLWLHSFTVGASLSFLDHHLKCGNSLIGVFDVSDVIVESSPRYREFVQALYNMILVGQLTDVTLAETRESARLFEEATGWLEPFRRRLDVSLAMEHFMELTRDQRVALQTAISQGELMKPEIQSLLDQALEIARQKRFFHWKLEFPEVWYAEGKRRENPGFDAVVGNPPWGGEISNSEKDYFHSVFESAKDGIDTYKLMIEQSHRCNSHEGFVGMIIPSGFLSADQSESFRKLLDQNRFFRSFVVMPYDVFPEAYVDSVIFVSQRRNHSSKKQVRILLYNKREYVKEIREDDKRWFTLPQGIWQEIGGKIEQKRVFAVFLRQEEITLLKRVVTCSTSLGKLFDVQRGITPFNFVDPKQDSEASLAFDGELRRYTYDNTESSFVHYGTDLPEYKDPKYFFNERVLLRELISRQFRLQAAKPSEHFVTNKSYQSIINAGKICSLDYLLCLLNSQLMSYFFLSISSVALRDDFPKIVLDDTRSLPIRRIFFTTPAAERQQLVKRLKDCYMQSLDQLDEILRLIENCLPKDYAGNFVAFTCSISVREAIAKGYLSQEHAQAQALTDDDPSGFDADGKPLERSDVIHDFLAFLAEQMIELNKQQQAETKKFLSWLEAELYIRPTNDGKVGLEALTNKTKLKNFLGDYQKDEPHLGFDGLWQILKENERRLGAELSPDFHQRLGKYYQDALNTLLPIKEKLKKTDELIDQIVYKLYGLTDAEIALVEGRASTNESAPESQPIAGHDTQNAVS